MSNDTPRALDLASIDHVLTTTRSVRLRLDFERPVPQDVIKDALRILRDVLVGDV